MTSHSSRPGDTGGVLSRTRSRLLAAVFGAALTAGAVAGGLAVQAPAISSAVAAEVQQPMSFANVVDRVRPAVVSVKVKTQTSDDDAQAMSPNDPMYRFFRQFGFGDSEQGNRVHPRQRFGMAQGSGFFISSDGYIVTNNHVVANSKEVDIVTDTGKSYTAKVIGTDPKTDLALIKVDSKTSFPFVQLGTTAPRVGDWVIAVGNPFGLGGSVTAGIVSARGRDIGSGPYDDFIQIDAPVNRGNSGGPTFDLNGNVIGVNTAIYSPSGGSVGIGFAIPADTVRSVVDSLKSNGTVTRGWIGVQIQPVTDDIAESIGLKTSSGALVADVTRDGPAAKAGIETGDAITAVNGQPVAGPRELARAVAAIKPGEDAKLSVWRNGKELNLSVATSKLPGDAQLASARSSSTNDEGGKGTLSGLGLSLSPAAAVDGAGRRGVVVTDVDPDSAAADSLKPGDIILDVAGKPVNSVADIRSAIADTKEEGRTRVLMRVRSDNGLAFVAVPLGKA